ncbi:ATP-binding protein [Streptomyces sp. MUM 203J]|uniref:ATP-binding protein n=1 Tax=Streptomyces sp. MUM 203J TaxID=2791990 RepID=UPI001F047081|nr:ATP-binding protein [Streptomyces sp. MUM 203J]MCH0539988.1 ATP-binding protein [Streptomyces sp. MUM 203J]
MNPVTSLPPPATHTYSRLFPATHLGARQARLVTVMELHGWRCAPQSARRAEQIVGELAANAVLHGRVRGRGFRLGLALDAAAGTLRIEVTDARGERAPSHAQDSDGNSEGGRGLVLVDALADHWGSAAFPPGGKVVWAELAARTV